MDEIVIYENMTCKNIRFIFPTINLFFRAGTVLRDKKEWEKEQEKQRQTTKASQERQGGKWSR